MGIIIRQPGILTTMQDLGRYGSRRYGIGPGGAMDRQSVRLINRLLGNDENAPVLEMHYPAARIVFEQPCVFAIGGADMSPLLNDQPISNWRSFWAEKGSDLRFASRSVGSRSYLAVAGGLAGDEWLGSSSTNLVAGAGGIGGRKVAVGDRIGFRVREQHRTHVTGSISPSMIPSYSSYPTLRITRGAEYSLLSDRGKQDLVGGMFEIMNNSDRMGFRLEGPPLELKEPIEMISSAVDMGTMQLLPDGQIIILMADHQTTGGYPRIAHIAETDMPIAAQLSGGDKAGFFLIDNETSEQLNAAAETNMAQFSAGCQLRSLNRPAVSG